MGRGVMEQSSLAHRKPSEDVFVSALSVEQGSSGTDLAGTCEEERAVLPATTVVKRLAASLYGWTAVLRLVLVVEIYSMIHLVLRLVRILSCTLALSSQKFNTRSPQGSITWLWD